MGCQGRFLRSDRQHFLAEERHLGCWGCNLGRVGEEGRSPGPDLDFEAFGVVMVMVLLRRDGSDHFEVR